MAENNRLRIIISYCKTSVVIQLFFKFAIKQSPLEDILKWGSVMRWYYVPETGKCFILLLQGKILPALSSGE